MKSKLISISSFVLTFVLIFTLSVPASASTYDERWMNVLDYATANNQGTNYFGVQSGSAIPFSLPGTTIVQDIDIVFRSNRDITSVKVVRDDDVQFTLKTVRIGSNLYRAFGQLGGYSFDSLSIVLAFNSGTVAYGEFLQLHISSQTVDFYNLGATIDKTPGVDGPSSHSSGSYDTVFSFNDTGDWNIIFNVVDWKKVDYLYFGFSTQNVNLGRICAYVGDRSLSVNVESFDSDPDGTYSNFISGYIDLYGVDRDGANNLQIVLSGTCYSSGNVWLSWLNGSIKVDSPSIFALIWREIRTGWNNTVSWLETIFTKIHMGFNSVVNKLGEFINGSDEMNETADNSSNELTDKGNELGSLADDMQAIKPNTDSVDVGSIVPSNGINLLSASISPFSSNPLVIQLLVMVGTLMLVSYVLFGKRG